MHSVKLIIKKKSKEMPKKVKNNKKSKKVEKKSKINLLFSDIVLN